MQPLKNRVVVITGASSGIGQATALALAQEGCKVAIAARRADRLAELKDKITGAGGEALVVATDVSVRAEVKNLVQKAEEAYGPVDILVQCAGIMPYTKMENLHEDEWEKTVDINCKGVLNGIGAVLTGMLERKNGHIVCISSDAGRKAFPGLAAYSGSKFFVEGVCQGLRLETAGTGVKVTCIQPGNVATELTLHDNTDPEALKEFGDCTGVEILKAEDIARSIVYAVSQPAYVAVNEILIEPEAQPI